MLKPISEETFPGPVEIAQKGRFFRERGLTFKFWFCDAGKTHPCTEPDLLTYSTSKSAWAFWLWVILESQN